MFKLVLRGDIETILNDIGFLSWPDPIMAQTLGTIDGGDGNNTRGFSGSTSDSIQMIKGGSDRDIFALNNTTIKSIETIDLGDAKEQGNQLIITGGTNKAILLTGGNKCDLLAAGFEWKVVA